MVASEDRIGRQAEETSGDRTLAAGELLYHFEGRLTEMNVVGILSEGLQMSVPFEGIVDEGPLVGARVWGIDQFLLRPDGIGVLDAPETISHGDQHVVGKVRGYALPPEDFELPSLEAALDPTFIWPEEPFRIVGSVMFRAADPELEWMNRVIAVITGEVELSTGRLVIEGRAAG